jgi:pyruvate dehydrogenase E1 component
MSSKLLVPDIGDFEKVEVIEVLVKEGDEVKLNDPVITIESDKSSVEIPSTLDGKIESLNIKVGDKVSKDDLILTVASNNASSKYEKIIPKDTENLIREAEQALKTKEKENVIQASKIVTPEKPEIIQVINDGDIDPVETQEWLESLSAVIDKDGNHRAHYLIKELINKAYTQGVNIPYTQNTPYINTIPADEEKKSTGDQNIERRIRSFIRWNAAAMVVRANKKFPELGGHIGTFASAATLYDVGINHFFRAKNNKFGGDLVYFQGHSAPGMYARAYLEGRLNEKQLDNFRQEVKPGGSIIISSSMVDA